MTFEVEEHLNEFGLLKDRDLSLSSVACCDMIISNNIDGSDDLCPGDPPIFDYASAEGLELDCAKIGLDAHLPHCIAKDEPSAFNKNSLSDYYRFE